jgi:outer membrane receptor protein involved in Fe transport
MKSLHLVLISALVLISSASAGITGKIAGIITDAETAEPLVGVNVYLEELAIGATTDSDGLYVILNVPAGTYELKASMIGYTNTTVENVSVSIDLTTSIDLALTPRVLEASEEVTVIAERPLLREDAFTSRHIVSSDEIDIQPVDSFIEIAQNQAGVVGSHFRGGRSGEVLVLIDGIPLRDPAGTYSGNIGGFTASVPEHAIQELEVSLGGFSAEYGNVQSGILNLAMKEGSSQYSGMFRYTTTNFGSQLNDALMSERDEWLGTTYQHLLKNIYQFNLSGPEPVTGLVLPLLGLKISQPVKFSFSAELTDKDQGYFINQQSYNQSYQGKLSFKLSQYINLAIGGLFSKVDWDQFYFPASRYGPAPHYPENVFKEVRSGTLYHYEYVDETAGLEQGITIADSGTYNDEPYDSVATYFVQGMQDYLWNYHKNSQTGYMIWTHHLSPRTFYELRLNSFFTNYHYATVDVDDRDGDGNVDEDLQWDITKSAPWPTYREREANYWWVKGDDPGFRDQSSWSNTLKADLVSQVTHNHLIKTGIELRQNRTQVENVSWTLNLGAVRKDIWDQSSMDLGIYVQDKMEFEGLKALIGLRFDLFDPTGGKGDVLYPSDYNYPYTEVDEDDIPIFTDPKTASSSYQLSPRIGIAYPITDRDVIHFSYGHYFQRADGYHLYRNLQIQSLTKVGNMIGNPDLKPEKTVSYEIGYEHLFTSDIKGTITGYYKDVTNLMNWRKYVGRSIQNIELNVYANADYGNIKGLEFSLLKRIGRFWGGSVNYTYSVAKGRSSTYSSGSSGFTAERRLNILNFDQTHTLNANLTFLTPESSIFGLRIGPFRPFANWRASLQYHYGSGLPYSSYGSGKINDQRLPATSTADLRLNKEIKAFGTGISFYMDILNLFNRQNVDWIGSSLYYETEDDPTIVRRDLETDEFFRNPQAYSEERQFRFGVSVKF